jgi:hypothetical protein
VESSHKRNYSTHDLELVAIVYALNMWRHYLMGKRFELRTDHNVLCWHRGKPKVQHYNNTPTKP